MIVSIRSSRLQLFFFTSIVQIILFLNCFNYHMKSIYSFSWRRVTARSLSTVTSFPSSSSYSTPFIYSLRSQRSNPSASLQRSLASTVLKSSAAANDDITTKALNLDIDLPTNENSENLLRIRHSSAHVMAMAVQRLYPDVKVTIGPWIDNGYDCLCHSVSLRPI